VRHMKQLSVVSAALLAVFLGPAAVSAMAPQAPVTKLQTARFGPVLATSKKQALYYWNREQRAGGKIRCVGDCAKAWPPLIVKSRRIEARVAGIRGRFATIRRPNGRFQVTFNGLAVYTYAHEGPKQVKCNNVNGWFVVRLR
jgi:predicted lipoprotein with Yx(FWY)xxD motif